MFGTAAMWVGLENTQRLGGTNPDLHRYARWEYGADVTGWLIELARRGPRKERSWFRRLRYWLNSFRGFAPFDIRGIDDRVRG